MAVKPKIQRERENMETENRHIVLGYFHNL